MTETETFNYDGIEVTIDKEVKDWDSCARRPYYQLRGKRITEEQAFDIISLTDSFFDFYSEHFRNRCPSMNFNMWWFNSNHYPEKYGWVHPNGIVGSNGITAKYPNIQELIEEWTGYLTFFPYLDLVAAISSWNELSPRKWDILFARMKQRNHASHYGYEYEEDKDFLEHLQIGIWVHDGKLEILNPERTAEKYMEYEAKYAEPDHRVYVPEYYSDFQPDIVTRDYLKRCIRAYGIEDAETFLQEKVRAYEIENLA